MGLVGAQAGCLAGRSPGSAGPVGQAGKGDVSPKLDCGNHKGALKEAIAAAKVVEGVKREGADGGRAEGARGGWRLLRAAHQKAGVVREGAAVLKLYPPLPRVAGRHRSEIKLCGAPGPCV